MSNAFAKTPVQKALVSSRQMKAYVDLHLWLFINSLKIYTLLTFLPVFLYVEIMYLGD